MVRGASAQFSLAHWDYDTYVPVVRAALEHRDMRIVGSMRGQDSVVFQAAPRTEGDLAVEVEVKRQAKSVDVHVVVYPIALLPPEANRFRIWVGGLGTLEGDAESRELLDGLLSNLRRDLGRRREATATEVARVPSFIFFGFKAGRITWFLGTVLGLFGVSYLLFYAPEGDYQDNATIMVVLAFVVFPFLGGLWGRSGPRGAFTGFLSVLVPCLLYGMAMAGQLSSSLVVTEALRAIATPGQFQGPWTVLLPLAFAVGGLAVGGLSGILGANVFPLLPSHVGKTAGI